MISTRFAVGAGQVLAAVAACLLGGCAAPPALSAPAAPVAAAPASHTVPPGPIRPAEVLPPARPIGLRAPSIGLRTDSVTEPAAGTPAGALSAGWPVRSAPPTVISAGPERDGGPAGFAGLADLGPGAQVTVHRDDDTTAVFEVYLVERFAAGAFPAERVHRATPNSELRLIAADAVEQAVDGPAETVVVFGRLVGVRE